MAVIMLHETNLLSNKNVCISLPDEAWGVMVEGQFKVFDTVKSCTAILPLLETKYKEIESKIWNISKDLNFDTNSFPYNLLLVNALTYPTSYWPTLAVSWLEDSEFVDNDILKCLSVISDEKSYDQKLRHRVRRLINKCKG